MNIIEKGRKAGVPAEQRKSRKMMKLKSTRVLTCTCFLPTHIIVIQSDSIKVRQNLD